MNKIKITTWIALVLHLFLFSCIAYSGIQKWGFHWYDILVAVVPPFIFFYKNIKEYDLK